MNFRKLTAVAALGMLLLSTNVTTALAMTTTERLGDFSQLVNIIEHSYGPLRWKKQTIKLDFKKLVADSQAEVANARTDAEFYRIMARFLASLHDAHVSSTIPSTYRARLGFTADLVEGKVLVDTIDRLRLPELMFPFQKGDELISIGNVPVADIMAKLTLSSNTGNALSTARIAAAHLASRSEATGMEVPKGVTTITVLPKGAAQPVTVTAVWIITGVPVLELDDPSNLLDTDKVVNAIDTAFDGDSLRLALKDLPEFNMSLPKASLQEFQKIGLTDLGADKSMFTLPEDAKPIPGISVTAAVFEAAGKKIGVLRIPSYSSDGLLEVLARAITTMQETTDVLVIDQTNNPGGSVSLVSDIISLFADKSFQDMNFEIRPNLAWVESMQDMNGKIAEMLKANPNDMAANALKARFEYLESELRGAIQERRFATAPVSLNYTGSFGTIQPAGAVNYKKPILLLINEFDFSGGDMFPVLMKDNGRVTLFGANTTGAGGNVREYGPLANSFFKFNLTESLMVRPNGGYVENVGAKPDVPYTVTEEDFLNGYRNYVREFTVAALGLVNVSRADFEADEAAKKAAKEKDTAAAAAGTVTQQ